MYQGREWGEVLVESQVPTVVAGEGDASGALESQWSEEMPKQSMCISGRWRGGQGASFFSVHPILALRER